MTITVFAIGTTGLPNFRRAPADPEQPRIVAIAATLYSSKWVEQDGFHFITRADGGVSSGDARAVHGVTERDRELFGIEAKLALACFMRFVRHSKEIATFNFPFARFMLDVEFDRANADVTDWIRGGLQRTCILESAGQRFNSGRVMTIAAAHEATTGIVYEQPARAKHVYDVRAAARVLQALRRETK